MKTLTLAALLAASTSALAGDPVSLTVLGAEHAHSGPAAVWSRASASVPNAAGNSVYAGTLGVAASPCGVAAGAGDGEAVNAGGVVTLTARAAAALAPFPFQQEDCVLHAWGLGYADPAPDPCLDPFDDAALLALTGDTVGSIPDVASETKATMDAHYVSHALGGGTVGTAGSAAVDVVFDDALDTISFVFAAGSALDIEDAGLTSYSVGLCVRSSVLGVMRTMTRDETGTYAFSGGWSLADLAVTDSGSSTDIDVSGLSFTVSVPGYGIEDFAAIDYVLEIPVVAAIEPPSPWEDLGGGKLGSIGTTPKLVGTGPLTPGSLTTLTLTDAFPFSSTALIVGLSELGIPFKGGVLVPSPDFVIGGLPTDGTGSMVLPVLWPSLPPGVPIFFQHWVSDPGVANGLSASNGLKGTSM